MVKRIGAKLIILVTSIGFSLLIAEFFIRLFLPQWSDQWKMWRIDPIYARGLRPSVERAVVHGHSREFAFHFSTNAQGLRMDHAVNRVPKEGTQRILFVGDSFTFGYGVEQGSTFSDQLQRRLDENDRRAEVINAGFASGFTLDTEYLFTREQGVQWKPNVVIAGVCLSNDLGDLRQTVWQVNENRLARLAKNNDWVPLWVKKSGLVNLVVKGVIPALRKSHSNNQQQTLRPTCELPEPIPGRNPSNHTGTVAVSPLDSRQALRWSVVQRVHWLMGTWAQHAHKNGYELVIMLIPDAEEVQWPSSPARLAQQASKRDIFVNAAKYWGVRVIDPVAKLRAHWCQTQEALYFNQDGHWNTAGHRFIGDWLADEL